MKLLVAILLIAYGSIFSVLGGQLPSPNSSTPTAVGTCRLLACEDHPDGGPIEYPYGTKPVGLLIYDTPGHMSIQLMKTPHPKVASGDAKR